MPIATSFSFNNAACIYIKWLLPVASTGIPIRINLFLASSAVTPEDPAPKINTRPAFLISPTTLSSCFKSNRLMVSFTTLVIEACNFWAMVKVSSDARISVSNIISFWLSFVANSMDNSNLKSLNPLNPTVRQKRTNVASPTSKCFAISESGLCTTKSGESKIVSAIFFSDFVKL